MLSMQRPVFDEMVAEVAKLGTSLKTLKQKGIEVREAECAAVEAYTSARAKLYDYVDRLLNEHIIE